MLEKPLCRALPSLFTDQVVAVSLKVLTPCLILPPRWSLRKHVLASSECGITLDHAWLGSGADLSTEGLLAQGRMTEIVYNHVMR